MQATHTVSAEDSTCTVSLAGEIDMANADEVLGWIRRAVDSSGCSLLRLDLAGLDFLDSSGVRMLVMAHDYVEAKGAVLRAVNPQDMIQQVLEITGVAAALGLPPETPEHPKEAEHPKDAEQPKEAEEA
ncbi:MAG TPA: STAS domain-containing protein [Candidatus Limnocylindrales bacterium]|nr:STAS domain-containing protein [Candidatus Limnocylindrales bacterium]